MESNYISWSQEVKIGLTVKKNVGFINGDIPCHTSELLRSWIIWNNVVTVWILNSLSKEISAIINFFGSTCEIWVDLQERYQRKNHPRIFQLRHELSNLMQNQDSITTYFVKLKTI